MKMVQKSKEQEKKKEWFISSDLALVQKTSAEVLVFLKPLRLSESMQFDIRLCFEEALINAMRYGNRLEPRKKAQAQVEFNSSEIRILIEDEGEGFNPGSLRDCTDEENVTRNGGRGVYLIHQLMDRVKYNSKGNRLLMVKFIGGKKT